MRHISLLLFALFLFGCGMTIASCDSKSPRSPTEYSMWSTVGMTMSYPSNWEDSTEARKKGLDESMPGWEQTSTVAGWDDPSALAHLSLSVYDLHAIGLFNELTEEQIEAWAEDNTDFLEFEGDNIDMVYHQQVLVGDELGWETEFTGIFDGVSMHGFLLSVVHEPYAYLFMYLADNSGWTELDGAFEEVRDSIQFE